MCFPPKYNIMPALVAFQNLVLTVVKQWNGLRMELLSMWNGYTLHLRSLTMVTGVRPMRSDCPYILPIFQHRSDWCTH